MNTRARTASILLAVLLLLSAAPSWALNFKFTVGKYDRWALRSQFRNCNEFVCQGCMRANFPDIMNPFDDGQDENCDGIHEQLNAYYWSLGVIFGGEWVSFVLPSERSVVEGTLYSCNQLKSQLNCIGQVNGHMGEVMGAYLLGSEFDLGQLDREFIDRWRTGPDFPSGADFHNFVEYCYEVKIQVAPNGTAYWHYATHAAAIYLADAVMAQLGVPTKQRKLDAYDVQLAKKIFVHAFVAQQCWELGAWEYPDEDYILGDLGIAFIPFVQSATPSFYYEIRAAIDHIFPVSVTTRSSSWGAIKSEYIEGGNE